MKRAFIFSVFLSVGSAGLVLAQSPQPSPAGTLPSGRTYGAASKPEAGATLGEPAVSVPPCAGEMDAQGMACDGDPCRAGGKVCGPPGLFWVSGEYLLWWFKDARQPPLVTTGPAAAAQTPPPGALGAPGTVVLFGGRNGDQGPFSGLRFTAGLWLDQGQTYGVEGSLFSLGSRSTNFSTGSSGAPGSRVLARPFFDVSTGTADSELIAFPGLASGTIGIHSTSRLQGAGANFLANLCCSCAACCECCQPDGYRVDLIGGFRYLDLKEGLAIIENTQVLPGSPVLPGSTILATDQFDTRNQFYGAQVGARASWYGDRVFANVSGTVAVGTTHQTVDIRGATTVTPPGGPAAALPGGFLAQPSNSGHFTRDRLSIVPEVGLKVGYRITNHLSVFVGYDFLYWSDVVRPADQIGLAVNSTRTPVSLLPPTGPAAPLFASRGDDFWAQGISLGVQLLF